MLYKFICNDCGSKFDEGEICPSCCSTNISEYVSITDKSSDDKYYVVYYIDDFDVYHFACKDSQFRIIRNIYDDDRVRFFTETGAIKAIRGIKKNFSNWDLHKMSIRR